MKKILVTGSTGFLGGKVLSILAENYGKENVSGTGRNPKQIEKLTSRGYDIISGDLSDVNFVREKLSGFTHIVHCAAKSSQWGSYDSFYRDNVIATRNLLREIKSISRFIYISTPSIYFDFSDRLEVKESDQLPRKFVNDYASTKYLAEKEVLGFISTEMIRMVIRPRAIIGAGDTILVPRVLRAFNAGRLKIIGDGRNICDFSSVKNIAHAVLLAMKAGKEADGKVFNITDDNPTALWPLLESTLKKLGFDPRLKKINYRVVYIVAYLSELLSKLTGGAEPVLTRYGVGVLKYSLTLDISQAKKILGYKPVISTEESLNEFVDYFKNEAR